MTGILTVIERESVEALLSDVEQALGWGSSDKEFAYWKYRNGLRQVLQDTLPLYGSETKTADPALKYRAAVLLERIAGF